MLDRGQALDQLGLRNPQQSQVPLATSPENPARGSTFDWLKNPKVATPIQALYIAGKKSWPPEPRA